MSQNDTIDQSIKSILADLRGHAERGSDATLLEHVRQLEAALAGAGGSISVGDISGSTAVAIGRDIQIIVHQNTNLPDDLLARLVALVDTLNQRAGTTAPVISSLHQLSPPPRDFTGREVELAELTAAIGQRGISIVGLQGMDGIGKTALALKLAEQLTPCYPDAQLYLDLGAGPNPLTSADVMARVVRAYDLDAKLPEGQADLLKLYCSTLHGQCALLLMDDVVGRDQVELLIPPDTCLLLITSRQRFTLPGLYAKKLKTLPKDDACNLLLKIERRIGGHAEKIARLCGYLPLALRAAGSLLAVTEDLGPAEYVEQLRDERTRLKRLGTEGVNISVEASLTLSYQHLGKAAAHIFRMLSVFPDTFDAKAEEAVCQDHGHTYLSQLVRFSLVEYDQATNRYYMQDLARVFAAQRLDEIVQVDTQQRHAGHYETVLRSAKELYKQGGKFILQGLALFDLESSNIQAGFAWAAANAEKSEVATRLCNEYPDAGAYILDLRQHRLERIRWLEVALAAAGRLNNRAIEERHLGNLGNAYLDLGEPCRAREFYEQALIIAREIGDKRNEGCWLGNLGITYKNLDPRRAIELYEQALAISREVCAVSQDEVERTAARRDEAKNLMNIGNAYYGLSDIPGAIQFHEQALPAFREIGDRWGEGATLGNLGIAYKKSGDLRHAIELYKQQLKIMRELGDHLSEGNAFFNISLALDQLGDRSKAITNARKAFKVYKQIGSLYASEVRCQLVEWNAWLDKYDESSE